MITRNIFKRSSMSVLVTMTLGAAPFFAEAASDSANGRQFSSNDEYYVYVGSRTTKQRKASGNGIEVYAFNSQTGVMKHLQTVAGIVNPSYLTMDSKHQHLYAVQGDTSQVSVFNVDQQNGRLTLVDSEYTGGTNPVHLTLTPDEQHLVIANYATGSLASLPILADGTLDPLVDLVTLKGEEGPHRKQQSSSHPHQTQYDPSQTWIVSPDKGLDRIFVHKVTADGHLQAATGDVLQTRSGAGPRHIAFHPSQPFGYVANELDNTIGAYRFDSETGALTPFQILPTLPSNYVGDNTTSGIFTSPDGQFVYISNRGHDSITIFAVDQKSGQLSLSGQVKTGGKQPRFFTFDSTGKWLFAANEKSNTITKFKVDPKTGGLASTKDVIETGSPVAMVFSPVLPSKP